ncbi:MAG: FAD-dependent oxidoreductase, partial [Pseudomonadota bacterium]
DVTGSRYYLGGLFTPGTAMLQPAMFTRGVAAGLRSNRLQIFENSPVTELSREGCAWRATTPQGRVTAPRVILAVNGHAESFGLYRRRLVHVMLYASMTRPLTADEGKRLGGRKTWGITPADPMGSTVRRIGGTGGDRIVVRNSISYAPGMEVSETALTRAGRAHDRSFAERFQMLGDVEMAYRWAGRLCLSLNDAPAFGEVEEGLFSACCQNGLGAAKGTLAGMAAADLATGEDTAEARFMAAQPGPRRLPPAPLAWAGATARLKWGEFAAGAEK